MRRESVVGLIVVLVIVVIAFVGGLNVITEIADDVRSTAVTNEAASCTTAAGATSCTVVLANAHIYFNTTDMNVLETSPGGTDRTAASTLNNRDRQTITVAGLAAATTYTFDVDYLRLRGGVSPLLGWGLGTMPLIWGGVLVALLGLFVFRRLVFS